MIGNFINERTQASKLGELEGMLWDFVARHHWPQTKHEEQRVGGPKLRAMFDKLPEKDKVDVAARLGMGGAGGPVKEIPAAKATPVVREPSAHVTNGTNGSATPAAAPKEDVGKIADVIKKEDSAKKEQRPSSAAPPAIKKEEQHAPSPAAGLPRKLPNFRRDTSNDAKRERVATTSKSPETKREE